jgi:Zn-finger in ubiquitin-hydrolases and other protein
LRLSISLDKVSLSNPASIGPEMRISIMDMIDPHVRMIRPVTPSANGCEDCLRIGSRWLHLRLCLTCGHVGCCDSSSNRHARKHFHASGHPIIQSFEPGEDWRWCYVDEAEV